MSLKSYLDFIEPGKKDLFYSLISDISIEGSEIELNKLRSELSKVKSEIDRINFDRQKKTEVAKKCEVILNTVNKYLLENPEEKEVISLKLLLSYWYKELNDSILYTKPTELLEKKYKIKEQIEEKTKRNNTITRLLSK